MEIDSFPVNITIRDGRQVLIREMTPDDAPVMLDFFQALPLEDRLFLRNDVTRPVVVGRFVLNEDHVRAIVAEHGGRVVGSATLQREPYGWMTHVGEIRVVLAHDFQRHGLGTAMIGMLVKRAPSAGIEKMVAMVMQGDVGAERAMERLGFHKEATLRRHVRDVRGKARDLHVLVNDVSHIWERMEALVEDFSPNPGG